MKVLITGAAGFLGLHLSKYLFSKKYDLILLDKLKFNKNEYPKNKCTFNSVDICSKKALEKVITNDIDIIIHAAAALPLCKATEIYNVNVGGTRNILDLAKKNKIKRVIFISSTAVYGVPIKHPIYEDDKLIGVGAYGESKIQAEKACFNAIKKGLNVTIIRPKTFVGTHRLGVFEILFDWIHDGKKIPVIGSGKNKYQLLDVDDLVQAIYLFTQKDSNKYNGAFNIAAQEFKTVNEDLNELFKYAASGSKIFKTPACPIKTMLRIFEKLKLSPLYQWVYDTADKDSYVSIDKVKKVLSWKPKYSNSQALIKSYKWYLENYKKVKKINTGITHTVGWKQGILSLVKKVM